MVFQRLEAHRAPLVFGADYDTPQGTCVRDFVHVADIASAHVVAARALDERRIDALRASIGRGEGVSVAEMVAKIRAATGTADQAWAEADVQPRRPGEPARVIAFADVLREALGWESRYSVEDMVRSAWDGWTAPPATAGGR
jgi:UDP-glucose 4-epimerase